MTREAFFAWYLSDHLPAVSVRCEQVSACGVQVDAETTELSDGYQRRVCSHVRLTRGAAQYEYDCVGIDFCAQQLTPLHFGGRDYLCLRKCLYGFTLLDVETLFEAYDYFPANCDFAAGEESFICAIVMTFGDYLIFDGCFWACADGVCVAFDPELRRFVCVSDRVEECHVAGDRLVVSMVDDTPERSFTKSELASLFELAGRTDLPTFP